MGGRHATQQLPVATALAAHTYKEPRTPVPNLIPLSPKQIPNGNGNLRSEAQDLRPDIGDPRSE
eukprot:13030605-Alexandrium_andersonii.AAC.1